MHENSMKIMTWFRDEHMRDRRGVQTRIADVGAMDVNGCYRALFDDPVWAYVGMDVAEGPNVDVVLTEQHSGQFLSVAKNYGAYDVVISGQTLEHVRRPWRWILSVTSLCRVDGKIFVVAPNTWPFHEHPIDCWRVWPDGMRALFDEAGLETIAVDQNGWDTWGLARRAR